MAFGVSRMVSDDVSSRGTFGSFHHRGFQGFQGFQGDAMVNQKKLKEEARCTTGRSLYETIILGIFTVVVIMLPLIVVHVPAPESVLHVKEVMAVWCTPSICFVFLIVGVMVATSGVLSGAQEETMKEHNALSDSYLIPRPVSASQLVPLRMPDILFPADSAMANATSAIPVRAAQPFPSTVSRDYPAQSLPAQIVPDVVEAAPQLTRSLSNSSSPSAVRRKSKSPSPPPSLWARHSTRKPPICPPTPAAILREAPQPALAVSEAVAATPVAPPAAEALAPVNVVHKRERRLAHVEHTQPAERKSPSSPSSGTPPAESPTPVTTAVASPTKVPSPPKTPKREEAVAASDPWKFTSERSNSAPASSSRVVGTTSVLERQMSAPTRRPREVRVADDDDKDDNKDQKQDHIGDGDDDDDVNERVEAFLRNFREQMRLQELLQQKHKRGAEEDTLE